MLTKCSVGLVVDANVIADIVSDRSDDTFGSILHDWLVSLIDSIDVSTRGRAVTLFVSSRIISDYSSGLGANKYNAVKSVKVYLNRKFARNVPLATHDKNRFFVRKINPGTPRKGSPKVADKYDQPYLDLLVHIKEHKLWKGRAIIIASRDEVLLASLRDAVVHEDESRYHIADNLNNLEDLIRC